MRDYLSKLFALLLSLTKESLITECTTLVLIWLHRLMSFINTLSLLFLPVCLNALLPIPSIWLSFTVSNLLLIPKNLSEPLVLSNLSVVLSSLSLLLMSLSAALVLRSRWAISASSLLLLSLKPSWTESALLEDFRLSLERLQFRLVLFSWIRDWVRFRFCIVWLRFFASLIFLALSNNRYR